MPNFPTLPAPRTVSSSKFNGSSRGDTVIDITPDGALHQPPQRYPRNLPLHRASATALPALPRPLTPPASPRCNASMKIGIASAIGGLGSCALLAHAIKRTIDAPPGTSSDSCISAVECGSPDPGNLAIEYVGAAVLAVTGLFGAGAAWMCRTQDDA